MNKFKFIYLNVVYQQNIRTNDRPIEFRTNIRRSYKLHFWANDSPKLLSSDETIRISTNEFLALLRNKVCPFRLFFKKRGPSFLVTTRGKKLLLLGNQSIYFWIEFPSRQKFRTGLKKRKLHLSLTGNFYVRSSFVTNKIISEFPLRD